MQAWHFVVHWLGTDYGAPSYGYFEPYDLYSGFLGLSFATAFLAIVRRHNCHVRWCWRLGRHPFTDAATGASYQLCRRHHPGTSDSPPRPETIGLIQARNQGER